MQHSFAANMNRASDSETILDEPVSQMMWTSGWMDTITQQLNRSISAIFISQAG
jgi:hypothetical protein